MRCRTLLGWLIVPVLIAATLGGSMVAALLLIAYTAYFLRGGGPSVHIVNLEGPPGAGKTWSLKNVDWRRVFGRTINVVDESIPDGVMADFYDQKKQAVVAYTFEHFTVALRQAIDWRCRSDTARTHIRDRTLISSHVFQLVGYTLGTLTGAQIDELLSLKIVANSLLPGHAVVYFGTDAALCHERVVKRAGADAGIDARYHEVAVFVHAYVIAQLVAAHPDVVFLEGTSLKAGYDAARHRKAVLKKAKANLVIALAPAEHARFMRVAGPLDVAWESRDGRVHASAK